MRLIRISLLALASKSHGFCPATIDYQTNSYARLLLPTDQIQSGRKLTSNLISSLSPCPSDFYFLINQPGVGVSDFSSPESAPTLSKFLTRENTSPLRSSAIISEVAGKVDLQAVERELKTQCGAQSTAIDPSALSSPIWIEESTQVLRVDFLAPFKSQPERAADVLNHDSSLLSILELLRNRNYTVIYTTTPQRDEQETPEQYSMNDYNNYNDPIQINLKRDTQPEPGKQAILGNQTMVDGPLFEKYQFLTPGLFTGLVVSLILLSLLYVAISAISSLQVSYAAFDKENGPAASQKKAQ